MKQGSFFLLLSFFLPALYAQAVWRETSSTWIPFGTGNDNIGIEQGEGEEWKPLFFAIDRSGNIHVPDFYKRRIAVFSQAGKLIRSVPVREGISPRMNTFSFLAGTGYVTFEGNSLYLIVADGNLRWKHPFDIGTIPARVFVTVSGIFVSIQDTADAKQGTLVFDCSSPRLLGVFGINVGNRTIPLVAAQGGKPYALKLGDMHVLPEYGASSFQGPDRAGLLGISPDLRSVWSAREGRNETVFVYSPSGELLFQRLITFPEGSQGTGFWTFVDSECSVYKNYYDREGMRIVRYSLLE